MLVAELEISVGRWEPEGGGVCLAVFILIPHTGVREQVTRKEDGRGLCGITVISSQGLRYCLFM